MLSCCAGATLKSKSCTSLDDLRVFAMPGNLTDALVKRSLHLQLTAVRLRPV